MSTVDLPRSMNEASDRDPHNNNCYGTTVDRPYIGVSLPVLDVHDFNDRIIRGYEEGYGEEELPADLSVARSLIPAGTATLRDFSYVAPEIPEYIRENCTGCMDCVTECPDTAILGKVLAESDFEAKLQLIDTEADRLMFEQQWSRTRKYYDGPKKKGQEGGRFAIIIDPSKCKGCAECVTVCDDNAPLIAVFRSRRGAHHAQGRSLAAPGTRPGSAHVHVRLLLQHHIDEQVFVDIPLIARPDVLEHAV